MDDAGAWEIEQHVREDAESIFVPGSSLPDAKIGDQVTVIDPDHGTRRAGLVSHVGEDPERGAYLTVDLPDR